MLLRRFFLLVLLIRSTCQTNTQPNIVLIVMDDMGWNDVGFHGSDQIPTPNLDALAFSGMILNRHYVLPTCTPSRTALFTGKYAIRTGMQGYPMKGGESRGIPLNCELMSNKLRDLGYNTHLVGKWHLGFATEQHTPNERGFNTFFGYYNGFTEFFKYGLNQTKELTDGSTENYYGRDLHLNKEHDLAWQFEGNYATRVFTDRAVGLIHRHADAKSEHPLFLTITHLAAHTGTQEGNGLEVPPDLDVNATFPHIKSYERRLFAGMVKELDDSIGRVVQALRQEGMLENSVIVVISDNGGQTVSMDLQPNWGSNYPLRGAKFTQFDGGVRGVALVWSSKLPHAVVSNSIFHITDWLPTLYTAAGGDSSTLYSLDGVDQWEALMSGFKSSMRQHLLVNIDEVEQSYGAILDGRWKIIKGGLTDSANYDKHSGRTSNESAPAYRVSNLRESRAGVAVLSVMPASLQKDHVIKLRRKARVDCSNTLMPSCTVGDEPQFGYVKKSLDFLCKEWCVFDLLNDPCECQPVINDDVQQRGIKYIKSMRKTMMKQTNTPIDAMADPALHSGVWVPWVYPPPLKHHRSAAASCSLGTFYFILFTVLYSLQRIF